MDKFPEIFQVTVPKPYIIKVLFDNNQSKYYDFNDLFLDDIFRKLSVQKIYLLNTLNKYYQISSNIKL